ncbi:MAG: beta-N-acetylhexosaminidase, partial [Bacteroidota bacterium]|nr:beta-N-acetylhexosaminidase [Bacteroidota bacterium]
MRTLVLITLLFPLWCIAQVNIIPKPDNVVFKPGYFRFKNGLSIKMSEADEVSTSIQKLFAERLFNSKEWKVPAFSEQAKNIVLKLIPGNHDGSEENYRIRVSVDSILVESKTYRGLFYGCQSVTQLVINSVLNYEIPCVEIIDTPQYQYRGMHLDVCRHFFPKEVVKQYIDLLGQLKMNVFHLHLTDDQAWRIEIKKYPKLTEVGGWRTEKDGKKYGGFYTQNDIQEIVAYAKERFVTVIPE